MFRKPGRSEEDFQREIEAHLQIEADRLIEEGMEPEEAMAAARLAFGNVARCQERFYESHRWMWLDHLRRDLQYAGRQVKISPISAVTIVLSIALGIGASTAIFSLADQALFRPLPVAAPEQIA
jgi:hypothetical protein